MDEVFDAREAGTYIIGPKYQSMLEDGEMTIQKIAQICAQDRINTHRTKVYNDLTRALFICLTKNPDNDAPIRISYTSIWLRNGGIDTLEDLQTFFSEHHIFSSFEVLDLIDKFDVTIVVRQRPVMTKSSRKD